MEATDRLADLQTCYDNLVNQLEGYEQALEECRAGRNGESDEVCDNGKVEELTRQCDTLRIQRDGLQTQLTSARAYNVKLQNDLDAERAIVKTTEIVLTNGKRVKVNGRQHKQFELVTRLAGARINVLLVGPAGTGKTFLAASVAKHLGLRFCHVSCSAGMSEGVLFGRLLPTGEGGQFVYTPSEFVKCYEEGGVFLLDEVDAADANVLVVVNAALANSHLSVPNRQDNPVAVKHPDFVCIAAANTYGTGANRQYVGRNQLDEATLDRFRIGQVAVGYDPDVEKAVCPDDGLRTRFLRYRRNTEAANLRRLVSMRAMEQGYYAKQAGLTDEQVDDALFAGWSPDEVRKVKS